MYNLLQGFGVGNLNQVVFNNTSLIALKTYTSNKEVKSIDHIRGILSTCKTLDKLQHYGKGEIKVNKQKLLKYIDFDAL